MFSGHSGKYPRHLIVVGRGRVVGTKSWVVDAKSVAPLVLWGFEGQSFLVSNIK